MQLETDLKMLGVPDGAPLPSAARLAAEAFFAPAMTTAPQARVATPPIVWRKKARAEPTSSDASADPEPIDGERRTPRVFRVEPAAPQPQAATSAPPSSLPTIPRVLASPPEHPSVPQRRRRKLRQLHGDVTIIRPPQHEALKETGADWPLSAKPAISEGDPASATVLRECRGAPLWPTDDAWPHYPKLLARIRLLQAEAGRARQREAAAAIRWVKRDIVLYGLTAEDLGFL